MSTKPIKSLLFGFFIYPAGDIIAQWICGEVNWIRLILLSLVGGFIYSFEIKNYFQFIEKKINHPLLRSLMAIAFFNPLWIARHILIIEISSMNVFLFNVNILWEMMIKSWNIGLISFFYAFVFSLIVNWVIQNYITLKFRFIASAIFSGVIAIYYALSMNWF